MFKKIFLLIIFFWQLSLINLAHSKINIIASVNNEIITNYDVVMEERYLKILNPQLKNLENEQISELAKQSLIKEIIKKNEISKFINLNEKNDFADEYLKQFLIRLGYENENVFKDDLEKYNTYTIEEIKLKSKIEIYWNDLILSKYNDKININEKKLLEKIKNFKGTEKKEFLLSEIVFRKKSGEDLQNLIGKIKQSVIEIGFSNTANIYSLSDSSKFGGKIGWVNEEALSKQIYEKIYKLNINEVSETIIIDNNLIILKVDDIKIIKNQINKDKELKKLISIERNKKLENFSRMHFSRAKSNYLINEK